MSINIFFFLNFNFYLYQHLTVKKNNYVMKKYNKILFFYNFIVIKISIINKLYFIFFFISLI